MRARQRRTAARQGRRRHARSISCPSRADSERLVDQEFPGAIGLPPQDLDAAARDLRALAVRAGEGELVLCGHERDVVDLRYDAWRYRDVRVGIDERLQRLPYRGGALDRHAR